MENKFRILGSLLRNFDRESTITLLAKELKLTRPGIWKLIKKLERDKLISLMPIGAGKTGVYTVKLDWKNPLLDKTLSLILLQEALKNQRWIENFRELENSVSFLILYGSILHSPDEANDIDILSVAGNNIRETENLINKIQKTQIKKIHFLDFTKEELKKELKKPNKAFVDAIKKGVVLFGQEKFVKFMEDLA